MQTEEVPTRQRWCQHPAANMQASGAGDGEDDLDAPAPELYWRDEQLREFLNRAVPVCLCLLEEARR